ncbi:spore germination protein [Brevibacillus fluminis]|uniref:Spore germination protein n=1 Tax=Brevibacillus fluminis TaxID=511487 RepID=A0A3M8CUX3_9BACL|nr:spore germination protein [Brevibacillus fluminis]RNB79600.1 spore germination protein [Brevibacillus fluminis]
MRLFYKRIRKSAIQQLLHGGDNEHISPDLSENRQRLQTIFHDIPDLITSTFVISGINVTALLVYLNGIVDNDIINNNILHPLLFKTHSFTELSDLELPVGLKQTASTWAAIKESILFGKSVLFVDGAPYCLILNTPGWPQRSNTEPQTESALKGSHLGFIESSGYNISLLRLFIPDQDLKIKDMVVGWRSKTKVSLLYLEDVVNPETLKRLEERIQHINIDAIITTGELEELIADNRITPFPQFLSTERPDTAASQILQGRIVMVVDHSPGVLVGPVTLSSFFQSIDDYNLRWIVASFIRAMRYAGFFVSIFLPALYIAALTFHYDIIPLDLILSIGESRERVPIPPFVEAILMELALEMLREAGLRLPSKIGQTVGIVGGIVIGQAAVSAGIVSNIMVIVVATTAIASFILPNADLSAAVRILRFPMMIAAYMFGLVGIVVGLMVLILHLISLESLGTPYGSPFAPVRFSDWKDAIIRLPIQWMTKRPVANRPQQTTRQGNNRRKDDSK